ncbi:MAG: glycosyl hydrolase [Isosphaeraceae bacterium]
MLSGMRLRGIGPAFMSGRIVDIAVDPVKRSTWYLAAGSAGVWKTENSGTTWSPIFDGYGSYSIGCVTVDPNNHLVVWVGTGENNSQRSVGYGDGLYRSVDGGKSFAKVGLEKSEHIAKILVDPRDSKVVYVAAQGPLWSPGGDRGLYKSTDGGKTWSAVLTISENTGVTDVAFDPRDPDVIYAAAYQRRRHVWTLIDGGPESGVYKSTDAGKTWKKINNGLPSGDKGRIGLAVSPIHPDVVYATVEAARGESGFFRSEDGGESWSKRSGAISSSPQYYQEIIADPKVFDRVYMMDTFLQVTEDGGATFRPLGERDKHVDNHAIVIDPADVDHLLIGCDGGLYETWDRGRTYDFKANLPITQFYKIAVDNDEPFYNVYGGTQDNATQGGPSRTRNSHGIRNSDWFVTVFGDGFDPVVDPKDPNIIYSQWQYGGLVRYDRKSGERIDIKPQEEKGGPALRWNWDSALMLSPHSSTRLYYGAQILYQSDDRGDTWKAVSPDLSRNIDRNKLKVMGRVWGPEAVAKNDSTSFYGSIVALAESPLVDGLIYAGTDDGLIQVTEDGGKTWRKIESFPFTQTPEHVYVSDVETSRTDPNTVFACLDNHQNGDFKPYVLRSTDRGKTWALISTDLPERGSAYTIAVDDKVGDLLFVGTEYGLYVTLDGGLHWKPLKGGMPPIAVRDLEIQRREVDLVVGTFGRGIYILDDYSPLRALAGPKGNEALTKPAAILPVKPALLYIPAAPMAGGERAFQGASYYTAPNPPHGATFTYHLKDSLETLKAARRKKEQALSRDGKDVSYPSWEEFKKEDREQAPEIVLTVKDAAGQVVRRLTGPASAGVHRVTWNLRLPGYEPATGGGRRRGGDPDDDSGFSGSFGPSRAAGQVHRQPGEARGNRHDGAGPGDPLRGRSAELRHDPGGRPPGRAGVREADGRASACGAGGVRGAERGAVAGLDDPQARRGDAPASAGPVEGRAGAATEAAGPPRGLRRRPDPHPSERARTGGPDRPDRDDRRRPLDHHVGPDELAPEELRDRGAEFADALEKLRPLLETELPAAAREAGAGRSPLGPGPEAPEVEAARASRDCPRSATQRSQIGGWLAAERSEAPVSRPSTPGLRSAQPPATRKKPGTLE